MLEPAILRRAQRPDIDQLLALEHHCFTGDRLDRHNLLHALGSPSTELWVMAEADTRIVASAMLLYRRNSTICRLYSIAVHPDCRGRGLAQELLQGLEQAARQRNCRCMRLEVRPDNPVAIRLYEKNGYRQFAEQADFYEDGCTALRMEKLLD